jgi:hypothetical protein
MRAADRRQHGYQHGQYGPGGHGIPQQGDRDVAPGQPLRHDARSYDRREKKCGTYKFGGVPLQSGIAHRMILRVWEHIDKSGAY